MSGVIERGSRRLGTRRFFVVLVSCMAFGLVPLAAVAAPAIERIELGFEGNYKLGFWTPLAVYVQGLAAGRPWTLEVTVPDSDGVPTRVRHPFTTQPGDGAERLYIKIGRNRGEMTVVLRDGETEVARRQFELAGGKLPAARASDSWQLISLGTTQHLINTIAGNKTFKAAGGHVATITQPAQLPDQWFGYDGVDVVLISAGAKDLAPLLEAKSSMAALDEWMRRGGTLLLSVGGRGEKLLASSSPAAAWSPGRFDRTVPLTDPGTLEQASQANGVEAQLEPLTDGKKFSLSAARLLDLSGKIKLTAGQRSGNLPLIVERRYGFGRVVFLAIDFDEPLLGRWAGTGPIAASLFLPQRAQGDAETPRALGEVTHAGYDDLAGQLRSSLDQFQDQGVRLLPFGALMGLMFAYIALLGPGDYFLLKRGLKRMELTWLTLPLLIVLSCGAAYALAVNLKGREVRLNQIDLVDYDNVQQARRATSHFTIFSPRGQAYDLSLSPPTADAGSNAPGAAPSAHGGVLLSWFGLPGTALGGMESGATAPLAGQAYDYALHLDALDEVPIPIWSTKSFVAHWTPRDAAPFEGALTRQRGDLEGLLGGTVTNRSPWVLTNCVLLTGRWAYPLGTLQPGQRLVVRDELGPRALTSHLTRRPGLADQYDRYDDNLERIVEVMSFYQAAGGIDYTRLKHRYEAAGDLSGGLADERAMLIGVRAAAAAEVRDGDQPLVPNSPGGRTVYRVIVPIGAD